MVGSSARKAFPEENTIRVSRQIVLRADVVNISLRIRVMARRSVVGSSEVLVVEEYGNPQKGLQFVSPRWGGIHLNAMRLISGRAIEDDFS